MSHQVVQAVYASNIPHCLRFLAVTLATYADPEGRSVFPSVERLAEQMRCGERIVRRGLAELRSMKVLIVESGTRFAPDTGANVPRGGQRQTTRYRFDLDVMAQLQPDAKAPRKSSKGCTPVQGKGCTPVQGKASGTLHSSAEKGAIFDTEPCTPVLRKGAIFDTEPCTGVQGIHQKIRQEDPSGDLPAITNTALKRRDELSEKPERCRNAGHLVCCPPFCLGAAIGAEMLEGFEHNQAALRRWAELIANSLQEYLRNGLLEPVDPETFWRARYRDHVAGLAMWRPWRTGMIATARRRTA